MCRLKLSRLFCLLFALSVFFGSFGLSASAASDSENLVDSDLRNWVDGSEVDSNFIEEGEIYVVYDESTDIYSLRHTIIDPSSYGIWLGGLVDETALIVGDEYTLSFYMPKYSDLPDRWSSFISENLFNVPYQRGTFYVGLAYIQNGHIVMDEQNSITIDESNYTSVLGSKCSISFTLGDFVGTPCVLIYSGGANSISTYYYNFISDVSLVNNTQSEEDGFFDRLFQFFHDLKWELIGGDCEDPSCPKNPHKSLPEKLGDLIKSLFVPDEQFIETWKEELEILLQERLGIIWDAGDFFISLIQTIGDLLTTTADDIHYELPEMVIELNGQTYRLWEAQQVDFSFLEKNAFFAMLYKLYKAVLNVFLGIPLLNYAKKEMDATLHN